MALLKSVGGNAPTIHPQAAFVAENAVLTGNVTVGAGCSVWYSAVLRADTGSITMGENTNLQDGCVLHTGPGLSIRLGSNVSVGHCAVLHGCTIEDNVLIGMHATVLNGAVVGAGSLIGAGAMVTENAVIPPNSLVLGVPGKVRGPVSADQRAYIDENALHYLTLSKAHAEAEVLPD